MGLIELFRRRVAARILLLFAVGALVPVGVLALLSTRAVTGELRKQGHDRLTSFVDGTSQLLLERLVASDRIARAEIDRIGTRRAGGTSVADGLPAELQGLSWLGADGSSRSIGRGPPLGEPSDGIRDQLAPLGGALLTTRSDGELTVSLVLAGSGALNGPVWVALTIDSIWSAALTLAASPEVDDFCVLDHEGIAMACLSGRESPLPDVLPPSAERVGIRGSATYEGTTGPGIAAWRSVFLRSSYGADDWYVVAGRSEASLLEPVSSFTYNLLLSLAIAAGLVLLLAQTMVRRTTRPLTELSEGVGRIARKDLAVRVPVRTRDEFGDLARGFNSMASQLSRQLTQLEASQEIDRAVIDGAGLSTAVDALLDGVTQLLPAKQAAVLLMDVDVDGVAAVCYRPKANARLVVLPIEAGPDELDWVPPGGADWLLQASAARKYLTLANIELGTDHIYVAPMRVQGGLVGVTILTADPREGFQDEDLAHAFKVIDRGAVALNELHLRRDLSEFGLEALRAMANAVDAKSAWTAGHSVRVTDLALAISAELGLDPEQLDTLYRGGLLHDVGKIGVPREVLDFPGRLDDDMRAAIEEHPVIGAKILEPVRVFRPLLPIVLHHHERWDGAGYPHGLAGEDIPLLARVLAVADVFDAMISPRPYRGALEQDFVVGHITEGAGAAFEPAIVDAFRRVIEDGWDHGSTERRTQ